MSGGFSVLVDRTGERHGRLLVVERGEDHVFPTGRRVVRWRCVCECGTSKLVTATNLRSGRTQSCGCLNRELMAAVGRANRKTGQISYSAAHRRVRKARGGAERHACEDCGGRAREWSYNRTDPDEWQEPHPRTGQPVAYSGDPAHYSPRCKPCHEAFDKGGHA